MWNTSINFQVVEEPHIEKRCPFAERFYTWTEPVMRDMMLSVSHVRLNQTLVQVTKKYREWRNVVPKAHKNRVGETGHICIFHVWDECCRAIEAIELSLTPPQLYLPEPVIQIVKELPDNEPIPIPDLGLFTDE